MGEAKRKKKRPPAGVGARGRWDFAPGVAVRLREKVVEFYPEAYAALEEERLAYNTERGIKLTFDEYLNALVTAACERERQGREARQAATSLITKPTAKQVLKVAGY